MTFEVSSSVTLLFDIWDVNGPAGTVKSDGVKQRPHFSLVSLRNRSLLQSYVGTGSSGCFVSADLPCLLREGLL